MNEYLVMYDIRGIQDYIFKTNKVKQIVGASSLVKNMLLMAFSKAVEECVPSNQAQMRFGTGQSYEFDGNVGILVELVYCGGGNLVAVMRDQNGLVDKISEKTALHIVNRAQGLSLVCAKVTKTSDYSSDKVALYNELERVKKVSPPLNVQGIIPICKYNNLTASPLLFLDDDGRRVVSDLESFQKEKQFEQYEKLHHGQYSNFDQIAKHGSKTNMIAIVHIDGNRIGERIKNQLAGKRTYAVAVECMRQMSDEIRDAFESTFINTIEAVFPSKPHPIRGIIVAGDDITFVCPVDKALEFVETYFENLKSIDYTACAGIVYCHKKYPFSQAYQLCEELCASAKSKNKDTNIGTWLDFHIVSGNINGSITKIREEQFKNKKGETICSRPYNTGNETYKNFKNALSYLLNGEDGGRIISNSTKKTWRDDFYTARRGDYKYEGIKIKKEVLFDAIDMHNLMEG